MKRMVINKYNEVLMVMGNTLQSQTTLGVYPSVQAALDGMSKFYHSTTFECNPQEVRIYGVVTESNGYKHSSKEPIYQTSTRQFWGGRQPEIKEIIKLAA